MPLSRPIVSTILALGLAAAGQASATWRDIPYADMIKMPLTLKKVDPKQIFTSSYRARPGKGSTSLPANLKLQVKVGGAVIPVPIQPDGRVDLPVRQDWADAGAIVQANQPKGRVALSMAFESRTPPGTQMSYAQLTESVPVMERGIKEMAGVMSFMAPKVRRLTLRFAKGAAQTVNLTLPGNVHKTWKSDADGRANVPWDPKWLAGTIQLSAPLVGIDQVIE